MAKTISELRNQSIQVRDASAAGENTATRVGTVLNDIVGHIEDYENMQSSNNSSQDAKIEGVKSSLNAEIARAKTEESNLSTQIGTERTERQAVVSREETARIQADNDEKTARMAADNAEQDARIKADNDEKTARENADITLRTMIQTEVRDREKAIAAEAARAKAAEQANAQAIADETARAMAAEEAETTRATTEEERLQGEIDNTKTNVETLDDKVNSNHDHLTDEVARLDLTDYEIKAGLEAETSRAKAAEEANATAIAEEKAAIMDTDRIADGAVTIVKIEDNAIDDEPTVGSDNLVKSGGVADKISELSSRTDGISKEEIGTEYESITIEDNNGNEVFYIDENGLDAKNVKSNGKNVLTEHQDISGKQDVIPQISQNTIFSNEIEEMFVSDDYDGQGNGDVYASIGSYGIKAKAIKDVNGNDYVFTGAVKITLNNGYMVGSGSIAGEPPYKHTIMPIQEGLSFTDAIHNNGLPALLYLDNTFQVLASDFLGETSDIKKFNFAINENIINKAKAYKASFVAVNLYETSKCYISIDSLYNYVKHDYNKLCMADIYPIVHGNRLELFKSSMDYTVTKKLELIASNYSTSNSDNVGAGRFRSNAYFFDSAISRSNDVSITFQLKDREDVVGEQSFIVKPIAKKSSPVSELNVLCIGDSYTKMGTVVNELKRRLTGSGGTPVADNLTNISFVGKVTSDKGDKCEGYSGMTYNHFIGQSSPFNYNGNINFSSYCSSLGIAKIDAVFIMLGANGLSSDNDITTLIDKIIEHNQSVKILIASNAMKYNHFGWSSSVGLTAGINATNTAASKYIDWNSNLKKICKNYNNVMFIDVPNQLDTDYNYAYELVSANNRNENVKIKQGIDNVHPTEEGMKQIADVFYNAFHYFVLS